MTDPWANRDYLRGAQYKTDTNLAARQSIYAFQQPRIDLAARVLDLAAPGPSGTVVDVGCGNGMYLAELARRGFGGRVGVRGLRALVGGHAPRGGPGARRAHSGRHLPADVRRLLRDHEPLWLPDLRGWLALAPGVEEVASLL